MAKSKGNNSTPLNTLTKSTQSFIHSNLKANPVRRMTIVNYVADALHIVSKATYSAKQDKVYYI